MGPRILWFAAIAALLPIEAQAQQGDIAINNPDEFNWKLFVQVNAPSGDGKNRAWETWADNRDTFPSAPQEDQPPTFPTQAPLRTLGRIAQLSLRPGFHVLIERNGAQEEVRRNKAAFDFIMVNKLWYKQGIANAFAQRRSISFPQSAIEIKAVWKPESAIPLSQRNRYYINTDASGTQFGLVAMHLISKELPNWTWATFEQTDNPGRCDVIGCVDRFGANIPIVQPMRRQSQVYPVCDHTSRLKAAMASGGLTEPFWQYYCLKGSQVDFGTATGLPHRLGNSVIEDGFVATSSCMTCHSRAAFDEHGDSLFPAGFNPDSTGPLGFPQADWFYNVTTPRPAPVQSLTMKGIPTDFVWSFMEASPLAH